LDKYMKKWQDTKKLVGDGSHSSPPRTAGEAVLVYSVAEHVTKRTNKLG